MLRKYFKHRPYKARKVLLVDDEEDLGWIMRKIMKDAGHRLICASTFNEGMQKFKRIKDLDMALIDLRLHDEDGLAFIRKAKKVNNRVRFTMITAFGNTDVKSRASQIGVTHFLDKPLNTEKVLEIVNHI